MMAELKIGLDSLTTETRRFLTTRDPQGVSWIERIYIVCGELTQYTTEPSAMVNIIVDLSNKKIKGKKITGICETVCNHPAFFRAKVIRLDSSNTPYNWSKVLASAHNRIASMKPDQFEDALFEITINGFTGSFSAFDLIKSFARAAASCMPSEYPDFQSIKNQIIKTTGIFSSMNHYDPVIVGFFTAMQQVIGHQFEEYRNRIIASVTVDEISLINSGVDVINYDDINAVDLSDAHAIHALIAPMGSGKTEIAIGKQTRKKGNRYLLVVHRKSLCGDLATRLGALNYLKTEGHSAEDDRHFALVFNSLLKPALQSYVSSCQGIAIDEFRQLLDTCSDAGFLKNHFALAVDTFATLMRLIARSTQPAIATDAFLSTDDIRLLHLIAQFAEKRLVVHIVKPQPIADAVKPVWYSYLNQDQLYGMADDAIAAGRKVAFAFTSLTRLKAYKAHLMTTDRYKAGDMKIVEISGKTGGATHKGETDEISAETLAFMSNPDAYSENENVQVLLFNSAITSGVSLTAGWYQHFFCHASARAESVTAHELVQMAKRIRHLREVHVLLDITGKRDSASTDGSTVLYGLDKLEKESEDFFKGYLQPKIEIPDCIKAIPVLVKPKPADPTFDPMQRRVLGKPVIGEDGIAYQPTVDQVFDPKAIYDQWATRRHSQISLGQKDLLNQIPIVAEVAGFRVEYIEGEVIYRIDGAFNQDQRDQVIAADRWDQEEFDRQIKTGEIMLPTHEKAKQSFLFRRAMGLIDATKDELNFMFSEPVLKIAQRLFGNKLHKISALENLLITKAIDNDEIRKRQAMINGDSHIGLIERDYSIVTQRMMRDCFVAIGIFSADVHENRLYRKTRVTEAFMPSDDADLVNVKDELHLCIPKTLNSYLLTADQAWRAYYSVIMPLHHALAAKGLMREVQASTLSKWLRQWSIVAWNENRFKTRQELIEDRMRLRPILENHALKSIDSLLKKAGLPSRLLEGRSGLVFKDDDLVVMGSILNCRGVIDGIGSAICDRVFSLGDDPAPATDANCESDMIELVELQKGSTAKGDYFFDPNNDVLSRLLLRFKRRPQYRSSKRLDQVIGYIMQSIVNDGHYVVDLIWLRDWLEIAPDDVETFNHWWRRKLSRRRKFGGVITELERIVPELLVKKTKSKDVTKPDTVTIEYCPWLL